MAEEQRKIFTLLQVAKSIQTVISERYKSSYWIKAEMNKLNRYSHSGHAYPELVEKRDGIIVAEMRSIIWKEDFIRINNTFISILKEPLKDGISILICARISYDPKYGLSLRIIDIDPSYSLGELEREKQENVLQLKKEGVFAQNKSLRLPILLKRIAIISVGTSKGYADFLNIMDKNPSGYTFFHLLFPAVLQGDKAVSSITRQLLRIKKVTQHFDAVAIIRGGGGDVGLSCYNDLSLARMIASFPLPVFTGIGHSTNETVAELVSHTNAITPTELAGIFITRFDAFAVPVLKAEKMVVDFTSRIIREEKLALNNLVRQFRAASISSVKENKNFVVQYSRELIHSSIHFIRNQQSAFRQVQNSIFQSIPLFLSEEKSSIKQLINGLKKDVLLEVNTARNKIIQEQQDLRVKIIHLNTLQSNKLIHITEKIEILSPSNVLKRGYSITRHNGIAVTSSEKLVKGEKIITELFDGSVSSIVSDK